MPTCPSDGGRASTMDHCAEGGDSDKENCSSAAAPCPGDDGFGGGGAAAADGVAAGAVGCSTTQPTDVHCGVVLALVGCHWDAP